MCLQRSRLHNHDLWLTIDGCADRKFAFERLSPSSCLSISVVMLFVAVVMQRSGPPNDGDGADGAHWRLGGDYKDCKIACQ